MNERVNVFEMEVKARPHKFIWGRIILGILCCLTIVGIPIGLGLFASGAVARKEHRAWKQLQKEAIAQE